MHSISIKELIQSQTEACSLTGVETNLLIIVLNVPVGGKMSYFRPQCEGSRKEGNNTSEQQEIQVPYTNEKLLTEQLSREQCVRLFVGLVMHASCASE